MFPANRVSLFPMPYQQKQPQVTSAAQLQLNERKGKIDFCVQADVASNCSSSDEDDESETNDSSGTSQKAEISTISSGIDETPPQNDFNGLQKADDLVPSAMPVPLRSPMLNASASMAIEPGHTSNLLINSSNRNSATSLDSGRGSAYATSSEGLKMIATSMSATFINPSGCPLQPVDIHTPLRMAPPPATPAHSRMGSIRAAASHLPSSISSAPSSASSSGISSCSSTCTANSGERSQVELLVNWLLTAGFSDYTPCIVAAGYDLNTLRRATPEDLNACGVTNPRDRQQLRARLSRLQLPESLPDHVPSGIFEWLSIINLTNYWPTFQAQGLTTFEKIIVLTWEDFEEIGVTKLGHQKKLLLAIERLRRVMSKRSEEQNHGTDSLNRSLQHQISLSPHQALRSASLVEDREIGRLNEITPPPPPRFQDPPKLTRKISIDCPTSINSPDHHRISHHKYFSTSFLADFGSTKSDPLPITDGLDIRDKEREKESRKDQHSKEVLDDSVLSARQRHKNAAAAAVPIPVSVANQMIPPPTSGATMDKDLQDMQDIRSMLDKLSEHLTSRGSP
nr:Sterile alpha motif SAM [Hymenolepis microstoma]